MISQCLDQLLNSSGLFIIGTDTAAGKTVVTIALMYWLQQHGYSVVGMKPVATGGQHKEGVLINEDAQKIRFQSDPNPPYDLVNPYIFKPPIAPHIAARKANVQISLTNILSAYNLLQAKAQRIIVEGVGGWRVPLADDLSVSDLPVAMELSVILVVGLRLGCINHAILTAEAITKNRLLAWVATTVDPEYLYPEETVAHLKQIMPVPCLGYIPWLEELKSNSSPKEVCQYITV